MLTLSDIRRELQTRQHWTAGLILLDAIEEAALWDADYAQKLDLWLSGTQSTVFLRETLCAPLRSLPQVIQAGTEFNPTTEWDNTWMPVDTAAHRLRHGLSDVISEEQMRAMPGFGVF